MADMQTQKPMNKPEQFASPPLTREPETEKTEQAAKPGRTAQHKADQPTVKLTSVTITIDPSSAEITRVEGLDASGSRHELSDQEKANLLKERRPEGLLAEVVERAFEAGIACVLGEDDGEEFATESAKDAELRRLLLAPLIERSGLKHLTERAALNRAILGTLIEHSMK